jgi:polyisoprenoid-binding protein YceI
MKRLPLIRASLLACVLMSPTLFAAESYTLDPNHSAVVWQINHFGFSHPSGKWYVSGDILLDEAKPQNSKVNITVPIGDVITGIPELDKHLKGKQFFDVEQFPEATFTSNKVVTENETTAKVYGDLKIHGITKEIELNVKLNKVGDNPITNKKTVGFTASTHLKRSDFGINTLLPGLGDDVDINIETEAFKVDEKAP